MASAKANKTAAAVAIGLPECPVCMETMTAPIFQCQSGHSLCNSCTNNLCPAICPMCRQPMTQMRNWQLEEIVLKAKVPCPNKENGCVYTMVAADVDDHLKECLFRDMECPLGVVFGKCSWNGKIKEMMDHFKERHASHCNVKLDDDVVLDNIRIDEDDRYFYLVALGKLLFIITLKIDTLQKMAYWMVQHIGSKKGASQHVYEIHVTSNQDPRRKVVFMEHCFNDAMKADEVFRLGKCAILPLDVLQHFISNKKLTFRFTIKKLPHVMPKGKGENKNDNKPHPGQKGPGPKGHGHGPKGPGPKQNNQKGKPNKQQN